MSPDTPSAQTPDSTSPPIPGGTLTDRRTPPRGVLPRQMQMWLMVGVAIVILGIILITGHPEPPQQSLPGGRPQEPTLTAPDRVRSFQQQLADDETRLRMLADRAALEEAQMSASAPGASGRPSAAGPATDELRQRAAESLFADNVAFSRRSPDSTSAPLPDDLARLEQAILTLAAAAPAAAATAPASAASLMSLPQSPPSLPAFPPAGSAGITPATAPPPSDAAGPGVPPPAPAAPPSSAARRGLTPPPPGTRHTLLEGTIIEAVLLNRLDGTFSGPVACQVTTPVYSQDRQHLLIPAGARLLGRAAPVQAWGAARLAVSFHRLVMPDGQTYSLDLFPGLSQAGETGLNDRVNRHYWRVFGASLAIGALSGLAQIGTGGGFNVPFGDSFRQSAGASLADSTGRVLDRYLNVLPTVTIREGYRIKVYLTSDLSLPALLPGP